MVRNQLSRKSDGFTLIELLIVVAIIGILAAIAVPNFLNAKVRAKTSRSFAEIRMLYDQATIRHLDNGLWLIDGNDTSQGPKERCSFPGANVFFGVRCAAATISCGGLGDNFFNGKIWALLTTPVNYIGDIPKDPFGGGLFYGYEDRECANSPLGSHWLIFAAGPDADHGDWLANRSAKPFHPSNGLISNGDIWKAHMLRPTEGPALFLQEIGFFDTYF